MVQKLKVVDPFTGKYAAVIRHNDYFAAKRNKQHLHNYFRKAGFTVIETPISYGDGFRVEVEVDDAKRFVVIKSNV